MRLSRQLLIALLLAGSLLVPAYAGQKGGGGFHGGGGRSFGGGSFSGGRHSGGFSGGRSFSAPRTPASAPSRSTFKPSGGFATHYDSAAAGAERAESSRSLYESANRAFSGGGASKSERVGPVTPETLETRPSREESIFHTYRTQPVTVYHDSFSPFFWLWLMDRSQRDRDLWVYNHRDEMDQQRYNDLTRKDADLENRLHNLEQQGVPQNPSYTPPGVDQDLMYDDHTVQQAVAEKQSHPSWDLLFGSVAIVAGAYLIFFVPMFHARRRSF